MKPLFAIVRLFLSTGSILFMLLPQCALAITYAMTTVPFAWIDSSTHNKITTNSAPYNFNGGGGCGTAPPTLDDVISDAIPLGFNFMYGGASFSSVRVMTNGRLQFGTTTCGAGTQNIGPPQTFPYNYPDANMNYTMRIYGGDLDVTLKRSASTDPADSVANYPTTCTNRNNCYISYVTLGTAPYRRFVVTWNNVPEWVNYTQTAGNFNLQIVLHENGEFIYQFGANNYASSGRAQIGWQVDNATLDYEESAVGLPVANTAYKYYIPRPVAEYRMEQPIWSGSPGEVLDTSGYARHASKVGAPQTVANAPGYICRGANIPANGNAATIGAIDAGVNMSTTVGSSGAITFWYKPVKWNGSGLVEAMLFDATTANNEYFYLVKTPNGTAARLRFVVRDSGGTSRIATSGNLNLDGNGAIHIGVTWSFNPLAAANQDFVQIYANGVRVANTAFSTTNSISTALGSLYLGDNRSSFVENANYGRSANGVIDEVRMYNFAIGLGGILRDKNQASACLDHYAISHGGTGSTCTPSTVTVTAHAANHSSIIMPNNTTQIRLSTTTGKGDWSLLNGYGLLDNGIADDGNATYLFNGEYQAVFGLTHTTSGTVNINVTDGQIVESEDPNLALSGCGTTASMNACEKLSPRCVAGAAGYDRLFTKLAGQAFDLDFVALKNDGAIDSSFNGTVDISLLANTSSMTVDGITHCPASQTATISLGTVSFSAGRGTKVVAANAFSSVAPNYSAYRDVRVEFQCSAIQCGQAISTCSTDNFSIKPQGFSIDVVKVDNSDLNNTNLTGTPNLRAGDNFLINATAIAGYNGTPTIVRTAASQNVTTHLGLTDYVGSLRDVSGANSITLGAANLGSGLSTGTVQYHNYGNFRLMAGAVRDSAFTSVETAGTDCVTGSYSNSDNDGNADNGVKLGCDIANPADTPLYGRFYPSHFLAAGTLTPACVGGNFSYIGQAFTLSYSVAAMSFPNPQQTDSVVMDRYTSVATVGFVAYDGTSMTELSANIKDAATATNRADIGAWNNGVFSPATNGFAYVRGAAVVPFENLYAAIQLSGDPDSRTLGKTAAGPTVVGDVDFKAGTPACASACTHKKLAGVPTRLRYGRLRLTNASGSDKLPLTLPAQVEYFGSSGWIAHADDSCTTLQTLGGPGAGDLTLTPSGASNARCAIGAAVCTLGAGVACDSANPIAAAQLGLCLTAPTAPGFIDLTFAPPTWLQVAGMRNNTTTRATFGIYPGNNRMIYRREVR